MLSLSSLSLSLSLSLCFAASNPYLGNFTSMISTSHSHSLAVTDSHTHTLASFHSTLYLSRSLTVCVSTKPRHTHIWLNFLSILQTHTHTHSISLTLTQLHKHTHTRAHLVDETFPLYFSFSWLRRHLQFRLGISDGKKLCCVELGLEREKQTFLVFLLFCVTFLLRLLPLFFFPLLSLFFRLFCHLQLFLSFRQKTKQIRFRLIQIFNRKK